MKLALMYIYPLDARDEFRPNANLWASSYLKFKPVEEHEVIICLPNGIATDADRSIFTGVNCSFVDYGGGGWDIGAFQHVAAQCDADLMVFTNSRVHFWKHGWMTRFVEVYNAMGPKGLYGASGSYESCCLEQVRRWPNPHIRTACFATDPKVLRRFPYLVNSRDDGFRFESGEWKFMEWYEDHGYPVMVVTWDGWYDKHNWRKPPNIFRKGDQTNCLVWDRHHDMYFRAPDQERHFLAANAG